MRPRQNPRSSSCNARQPRGCYGPRAPDGTWPGTCGRRDATVERALPDYDQRRTRLATTGTTLWLG